MSKNYNDTARAPINPQELYNELKALVGDSDFPFFSNRSKTRYGTDVIVFGHRNAGFDRWTEPSARECRGILFEMAGPDSDEVVRIMSRPLEKFFNWGELDISTFPIFSDNIEFIEEKEDGYIMSTFYDNFDTDWVTYTELCVKSKTSLESSMVDGTMALLNSKRYKKLKHSLLVLAVNGYTVNMEYVTPSEPIVINYKAPTLVIYDVRHNNTGNRVLYDDLDSICGEFMSATELDEIKINYVRRYKTDTLFPKEFEQGMELNEQLKITRDIIKKYKDETTNVEGLIIFDKTHGPIKLKTRWYTDIHNIKFTISSSKSLFRTIIDGHIDDIKVLYLGEQNALNRINAYEAVYYDEINKNYQLAKELNSKLMGLDRKSYAINAQHLINECGAESYMFGIIMNMYNEPTDWEKIISILSERFMMEYRRYIPEKYKSDEVF